jgi:O-antigen/teichoic acid export membrane protein
MIGARGVASVTAIVTVPLTLSYLGVERYGMWMTLSSFIALLTFADLGLGNGLLTAIAKRQGEGDRAGAVRDTASAMWTLVGVALALLAVFLISYRAVDWPAIFNVRNPTAANEAGPSVVVFVVCIAVALPLSLGNHLRNGFQEGFVSSAYVGLGNLIGFAGVLLVINLRLPLPFLVAAMMGGPLVASAVNVVHLFVKRPWLLPRWSHLDSLAAARMLASGSQYLALQLATALAFATDSIIAAQIIGPRAVTDYAVVSKLFLVPSVVATAALFSLWPAYAEALGSGDHTWIAKTFKRSLWLALALTLPLSMLLAVASEPILSLWIGSAVHPPRPLVIGMAIWTVLNGLGAAVGMLLNALQKLPAQIASWFVMALANIALSIVLTQSYGVSGVIWGSVVAFPICTLVPMAFYARHILRGLVTSRSDPSTSGG